MKGTVQNDSKWERKKEEERTNTSLQSIIPLVRTEKNICLLGQLHNC